MADIGIAQAALDGLTALAALERPGQGVFEDGAPLLQTRFFAEEAAAAALGATGLMAEALWRDAGGEAQTVEAGLREAGANLISFMLQTFEDPALAPGLERPGTAGATPAEGFFPTADGRHVYLHPSFAPSAARLHQLLGAPEDRDAAARIIARRPAQAWEDEIAAAGLCAAVARTPQEWDESEQGRILAARPVVEVVQIGDSPPEPLPASRRAPLEGVRALDLTRVLAGPTCARTLAQYGAEALYVTAADLPTVPLFVADTNPGKLSTFIDLKTDAGRAKLHELLQGADIFTQGYRSGALARLGFSPLALAQLRPGLIHVEINCYGHEGPWRGRPGWEQLAQTATGLAWLHGRHMDGDEGAPRLQPAAVCDYTTGFLAAFGAMIALRRRARHGGSYLVRVSLAQTAVWLRRLGLAPAGRLGEAVGPSAEELAAWRIRMESGFGPVSRLRPPVRLSRTRAAWTRPLVQLGAHPPAWPEAS